MTEQDWLAVVCVLLLILIAVVPEFFVTHHEWEIHFSSPWRKTRLIDGTYAPPDEILMRRKMKGEWQYRLATDDEYLEWRSQDAW